MESRESQSQHQDKQVLEDETSQAESDENSEGSAEEEVEKKPEDNKARVDEEEIIKEEEKVKRKGVVEIMNDFLESIFATEEEHDDEIEEELSAMYRLLWTILSATIGVIAVVVTLTKYPQYLSILHENQLWFSNIKEVEREISFRTEQALYYSHYKHLVHSHTWREGFSQLLLDNGTEHGRTINTFHRFNILPEVVLSAIYRWLMPEESPSVFYVWSVFSLHGVYAATLYVTAWHFSGSVLSGAITVVLFIIHRTDVTRVNYTVPLRESFAVPFLFLQTFLLCSYLRNGHGQKLKLFGILVVTVWLLLSWQFGPFILLCQLLCLMVMARLVLLPQPKVLAILGVIASSLVVSCWAQSNPPLTLSSPALSMVIPAILLAATPSDRGLGAFLRATIAAAELSLLTLGTVLLNGFIKMFLNLDADSHVYQLLLSKLRMGSPKDFDSRLYMCTDAFDYMDMETLKRLSLSGLLPVYAFGILTFSFSAMKQFLKPVEYEEEEIEFGDVNRLNTDEILLHSHLARMNLGIRHIDSEIQKVAQLVAGGELYLPPLYSEETMEEENSEFKAEDKPHNSTSGTSQSDSVQLPLLVDGKPDLVFFIAVSLVWGVLAVLVVRLKVLWLPSVCVVVGVMVGELGVYTAVTSWLSRLTSHLPRCLPTLLKMLLCFAYLAWLVHEHWAQVWSEVWPEEVYEFWDPDTVDLMEWVGSYTPASTTVLAGSMQLMAGVRLCTGRSITNHPHYEDSWLRHRTHQVYRVYGRDAPEEVHAALRDAGATHIILEDSICLATQNPSRPLCRLTDIVDLHNGHEPAGGPYNIPGLQLPQHPRFCDEVRHAVSNYTRLFSLVMKNKTFRVYRLAQT